MVKPFPNVTVFGYSILRKYWKLNDVVRVDP